MHGIIQTLQVIVGDNMVHIDTWSSASTDSANDYMSLIVDQYSTGWQIPAPVFEPVDLWQQAPKPGDVITIEALSEWIRESQAQVLQKMESIIEERLSKLLFLYIDALRWGRPDESFTGLRCIGCGAPAEEGEGCEYCGR